MKNSVAFSVLLLTLHHCYASVLKNGKLNTNEDEAIAFLVEANNEMATYMNKYVIASFNYETNLTDYTSQLLNEASVQVDEHYRIVSAKAAEFDTTNFSDDTKRQMRSFISISLDADEANELQNVLNQMGNIYGTYQACRSNPHTGVNECMYLDPQINELMATTTNPDDHLWAWQAWHDGVGRQLRPLYLRFAELENKQARLNGYADYGDQWRQAYETTELETIVQDLYAQVEPLYKQLHAYIRRQLYNNYPGHVDLRGPLPAHLLGDMWGRFWVNLNSFSAPYPDKPSTDPTPEMINQGYTIDRMFRTGDEFYTSMGMKPVPDTFWNLSMFEKPSDREVICHPWAVEFWDAKDYRIRMCSKIDFVNFQTLHHEMGHIQYYQQYAFQPYVYRNGANDGFQEAIGELMSMSFSTTTHLNKIGLLNVEDDPDVDMNFLLFQALSSISPLPFHLVQDRWQWKLFAGQIPDDQLNDEYWAEKRKVVGVAPPVARDSKLDLDITTIFHVCSNTNMIRYFMRTFYQYQFNEVLCEEAGHVGPLYKCDFFGSTAAGTKIAEMLKLGSSKPWQDAVEVLTGQRDILATPLLNYFEPLRVWLEAKNKENNEFIGWE